MAKVVGGQVYSYTTYSSGPGLWETYRDAPPKTYNIESANWYTKQRDLPYNPTGRWDEYWKEYGFPSRDSKPSWVHELMWQPDSWKLFNEFGLNLPTAKKQQTDELHMWAKQLLTADVGQRQALLNLARIMMARRASAEIQAATDAVVVDIERLRPELISAQADPAEPPPWYGERDRFGLPAWVAPAVIGAALLLLGGR